MLSSRALLLGLLISCASLQGGSDAWLLTYQQPILPAQTFCVQNVTSLFRRAFLTDEQGNSELLTLRYVEAYTELVKVFDLFGVVFYFAREDITSKLTTLTRLHREDDHNHYRTFASMFQYENLPHTEDLEQPGVSASRWTQRAMLFIAGVIGELIQPDVNRDLSQRVQRRYSQTLAPHHSWVVQAAARLAMNYFPSRNQFLSEMNLRDDESGQEALTQLRHTLTDVYDHVNGLCVAYEDQ